MCNVGAVVDEMARLIRECMISLIVMEMQTMRRIGSIGIQMPMDEWRKGLQGCKPDGNRPK